MLYEELIAKFIERQRGYPKIAEAAAAPMRAAIADEDEIIETTEGDVAKPPSPSAAPTHINLFQHPDAHPIVLDILLLQKYGPEWMTWEAETLRWRVPKDFHTSDVSDLNMTKIQAMKTLHFVDTPWLNWEVFLWCCISVNGLFPDFEVLQVPTAAQCMVAIDIFNKVRQDVAWSDEVKTFLGTVWRHESMFCPTDPADFFEVDQEDTTINCPEIRKRWPEVRKSGHAPNGDNEDDEQLRRMLDAHKYLQESRDLFDRQIGLALGA